MHSFNCTTPWRCGGLLLEMVALRTETFETQPQVGDPLFAGRMLRFKLGSAITILLHPFTLLGRGVFVALDLEQAFFEASLKTAGFVVHLLQCGTGVR